MWLIWTAAGGVIFVAGIVYLFVLTLLMKHLPRINWLIAIGLLIIGIVFAGFAGGVGLHNYAQIPRIHQNIKLEAVNKAHYHIAMKYNLKDESNERKTANHVRWFHNGDFSEAQDNQTWKQNYSDWYYNKSLITYHKMQLKYYEHPLHNWRDGAGLFDLDSTIHKPANYQS